MPGIGSLITNSSGAGIGDILYRLLAKKQEPGERWVPQSMEEALEFEQEKARIKADEEGQKARNVLLLDAAKKKINVGSKRAPFISSRKPVMSLPGGEVGDIEGKRLNKRVFAQDGDQTIGQKKNQAFILNPNFELTGEGDPLIKNPAFIKPKEVERRIELTGEQEVKARTLSRRLFGVRGARDGLPSITKLMSEGKTVDEIQDLIRFGGQSEAFTGAIRSAAQEVLITTSPTIAERSLDFIDDELSKGNITGVKSKLKRIARKTAGTEQSRAIMGKERTVEFLGEIQDDLDNLEQLGIDTNIFSGTIENINEKIGRVKDPESRKVATKIKTAIQNYRRAMSGVAFSVPESEEYKELFPSISKTAELNTTVISALNEVMQGDLDSFYGLSMGEDNYSQLFGEDGDRAGQQQDEYERYLQAIGGQ